MVTEAQAFLRTYQQDLARLEIAANLAQWQAANSGTKEDYDAAAQANLALRTYHSDAEAFRRLEQFDKKLAEQLSPLEVRSLRLAKLAYQRNQLPRDVLEKMVNLSSEIERLFSTFRAELNGQRYSNNDLLEMLRAERDSGRRQQTWEALKQVGAVVAPKLIELAKLRNAAARSLGYPDFWQMSVRLQEHEPDRLLQTFAELERLTSQPFATMKAELDREVGARLQTDPARLQPWHYDNPFFQAAPPSQAVDLDEFYSSKKKEDIVETARRFFADIGLPIDEIIARSDLYEREGKDQHAFCTSIDRAGDVRTLCNIKPTAEWMDTMLHEQGHAIYDVLINRSLPFNVREPSHIFTTEGVAMLMGALAKTPSWMVGYAGADPERVRQVAHAIVEQRRREQLIFARWTMVMLHFEKALYENPDGDLNTLWWDYVEKYQLLRRPPQRHQPDWASKPHFTIAPVYYHNYMLGELFAAQLRHALAKIAKHEGPSYELSFNGRRDFGEYLRRSVFASGSTQAWPQFVQTATGEPLTASYFAQEVQ
jgi:peptidyl-dipeptidase A